MKLRITVLIICWLAVFCEGKEDKKEDKDEKVKMEPISGSESEHKHGSRRTFYAGANQPSKIACSPGAPGPPGTPGAQGMPGRDGRDGRDCPPCNCAAPGPAAHVPSPVIPDTTCHGVGSLSNPARSCDELFTSSPTSTSGTYWLDSVHGSPYQTHCELIRQSCDGDVGGWSLVARTEGSSPAFAPTSPLWANDATLNQETAADLTKLTSMKNAGWSSLTSQAIRVCYSGPRSHCATFTHGRGMPLSQLFASQFAVETKEGYMFGVLMKKFGKHLDLSHLKTEWCGLNLGNLCNLVANPNRNPGSHMVRIGCIGDTSIPRSPSGCNPDDYSIGIGVTSCNKPNGCHHFEFSSHNIGKSLHFSSYPNHFGYYDQTAFIYVK